MGGSCCNSCLTETSPCEGDRGCGQVADVGLAEAHYVCADHLSLNSLTGTFTALEHYPVGDANAVEVVIEVFAGTGLLNGMAIVQGSMGPEESHVTLGSVAFGALGVFTLLVTGIAVTDIRMFFVVPPAGMSSYTVAVDIYLSQQP